MCKENVAFVNHVSRPQVQELPKNFSASPIRADQNRQVDAVHAFAIPNECNYLLTGGSDSRIRFWDMANIEKSFLVSDPCLGAPTTRFGYGGANLERVISC